MVLIKFIKWLSLFFVVFMVLFVIIILLLIYSEITVELCISPPVTCFGGRCSAARLATFILHSDWNTAR